MRMKPRDLLRKNESIYKSLNLGERELSDAEIVDLMVEHPDLIQRPIAKKGARAMFRPARRKRPERDSKPSPEEGLGGGCVSGSFGILLRTLSALRRGTGRAYGSWARSDPRGRCSSIWLRGGRTPCCSLSRDSTSRRSTRAGLVAKTCQRLAAILGARREERHARVGRRTIFPRPPRDVRTSSSRSVFTMRERRAEWERAPSETVRVLKPEARLRLRVHPRDRPDRRAVPRRGRRSRRRRGLRQRRPPRSRGRAGLDRDMARFGLVTLEPIRTARPKVETGRRVSANGRTGRLPSKSGRGHASRAGPLPPTWPRQRRRR